MSVSSVVWCQVVSATGRSLVQRSPTDCSVSNWMWLGKPQPEKAYAHEGCWAMRKQMLHQGQYRSKMHNNAFKINSWIKMVSRTKWLKERFGDVTVAMTLK
jgi:hypothetical protein